MTIYVASSWRNERQPEVVQALRAVGLPVYDFRNPEPGDDGFHWSEIDPKWKSWSPEKFREALAHPIAQSGFRKDMEALRHCTACVLVMPCGRSAHLEMGFAIGAGKPTVILLSDGEPELMYNMVDLVTESLDEAVKFLQERTLLDVALTMTKERGKALLIAHEALADLAFDGGKLEILRVALKEIAAICPDYLETNTHVCHDGARRNCAALLCSRGCWKKQDG